MLRLKSSRTDAGSTPFIDMTPMIDMVFQLLIFFLLTSIFAAQPALDLTLPSAEHAKEEAREESVHLFIQKEGTIFIDEEEISLEGLGAALQAKVEADRKRPILLSADREAPFQRFVDVLDVVRHHNHSNLTVLTRPKGESP
ncbi:ExbD/TolR family protein [Candidatus Manganitrophus noduliformans]|uniref:Biopolymer transporter ExbD n=1 Tax=Candidatus Manganitrophus noduliformans TaxID=2606439 RepID=A0A7X6DUH8_9BACT|nr:biopolymer transporter ExbD [Candidatus Manganitrophus noduliformans]NKE73545.1 biopolymer transporter ExbD [Candidatus Manganitrophus noduliformans]